MKDKLMKLLAKQMRDVADKIDSGTCELSTDEAVDILSAISHHRMSKEESCKYLNLSRSRFDDLVRDGIIPKGRKELGISSLVWYQDELDNVVRQRHKWLTR